MDDSPRWVGVREASRMLGLNPRSVRRLAAQRRLRHFRLGHGTIRFRPEDVTAFLEASRVEPMEPPGAA
jgi:excisionase family DNA binding protein